MELKKDDSWISKDMPFVAFKSSLDIVSQDILRNHSGKTLLVDGGLDVDKYNEKSYFKFIINKVDSVEEKQAPAHFQESSAKDEEIPF